MPFISRAQKSQLHGLADLNKESSFDMNLAILSNNSPVVTMTSREIAQLTNKQHQHVLFDIRKMLVELEEDESSFRRIYLDSMNRDQIEYALDRELTETLLTGYSAKLRRAVIARWQELEGKAPPAAPTTASMFMQSAHIMLEMESRTAALEKQQIALTARLDEVVENNVLKVCPQNAESITHIRKRINKAFGLSANVIDEAMRQLPYSPKPAGMVLNDNEAAQGSHYAVYWTKDVTAVFRLFASECQRETTAFVSHPFIDSRFKLAAGKECK